MSLISVFDYPSLSDGCVLSTQNAIYFDKADYALIYHCTYVTGGLKGRQSQRINIGRTF